MNLVLRTFCRALSVTLTLCLMTGCYIPPRKHAVVSVQGQVFDSDSLNPLREAQVTVLLTKPRELLSAETTKDGSFTVYTEGELEFFAPIFEDGTFSPTVERALKIKVAHPSYVEDFHEENFYFVPESPVQLDIGSFYLEPRDER